jgi:hypothetical protein
VLLSIRALTILISVLRTGSLRRRRTWSLADCLLIRDFSGTGCIVEIGEPDTEEFGSGIAEHRERFIFHAIPDVAIMKLTLHPASEFVTRADTSNAGVRVAVSELVNEIGKILDGHVRIFTLRDPMKEPASLIFDSFRNQVIKRLAYRREKQVEVRTKKEILVGVSLRENIFPGHIPLPFSATVFVLIGSVLLLDSVRVEDCHKTIDTPFLFEERLDHEECPFQWVFRVNGESVWWRGDNVVEINILRSIVTSVEGAAESFELPPRRDDFPLHSSGPVPLTGRIRASPTHVHGLATALIVGTGKRRDILATIIPCKPPLSGEVKLRK